MKKLMLLFAMFAFLGLSNDVNAQCSKSKEATAVSAKDKAACTKGKKACCAKGKAVSASDKAACSKSKAACSKSKAACSKSKAACSKGSKLACAPGCAKACCAADKGKTASKASYIAPKAVKLDAETKKVKETKSLR